MEWTGGVPGGKVGSSVTRVCLKLDQSLFSFPDREARNFNKQQSVRFLSFRRNISCCNSILFIITAPSEKEDYCLFNVVLKHIWDGTKCTLMESINLFNLSS